MLDFQRHRYPEERHGFNLLPRPGLPRPNQKSTVVDISKLLESRDSLSPTETRGTASTAQTPIAPSHPNSIAGQQQRSYNAAATPVPAYPVPPPQHLIAGGPPGGPVRSPPQLPPVSALQLQPPPYQSAPAYQHPPQSYYSSPPPSSTLPSYSAQNLPPLSHAVPPPNLGPNSLISPAVPHAQQPANPNKRSADSAPQSSPPPKKHHGKWTEEEDNLAIELRRRGMKWDDIAKRIPGRSAISCRLRYQNYSEKRPNWDEEKKNKLARLYNRFKRDMWEMVATEMGLPWRAVEAMHWQMGQEEMASRANVPVFQPHPGSGKPGEGTPPPGSPTDLPPNYTFEGTGAHIPRVRRSSSVSSRRPRADSGLRGERPTDLNLPPVKTEGNHLNHRGEHPSLHPQQLPPLLPNSATTATLSDTARSVLGSVTSPAGYSEYATPSPPVYARSVDERSAFGGGTPHPHNRSGSQSSIKSSRSLLSHVQSHNYSKFEHDAASGPRRSSVTGVVLPPPPPPPAPR